MNALKAVALLIVVLLFANADVRAVDGQCVESEAEREHIRKIMLAAFEQSFRIYIGHLFDVWLKDTTEQPVRAVSGINISVNAYNRARASTMKWNPPLCSERK